VVSFIAQNAGLRVEDPSSGRVVEAINLFSAEGLRRFVQEIVQNFAHFAPFGLVLVMLMGVSIAEKSGFLSSVMKGIAFSVPDKVVIPIVFILGACGNIGSDAGIVIIPPIAALVFAKMGKHPVAGLVVGYAGATAGFSANLLIAGTDVLLAGISTEVAQDIGNGIEVSATANWYFMIVSTFVLGLAGTVIALKFTIPKCREFKCDITEALSTTDENGQRRLTAIEKKGLLFAGIALFVYVIIIGFTIVPDNGVLRHPETGTIVPSPFLRGLVPILFLFFAVPGYVYGKVVGSIGRADDLIKFMAEGMKDLAGYIVLMFVVAQFINLFKWSHLDQILAIKGAEFLKATGLTGPLMFIMFILLIASVNIFIGSGSAKWAIFAPIFVPMLAQLNYNPAFVQLLYRIGDSVTNCISPLYPYFPLMLGWVHKYHKKAGVGTIISLLLPYAILLLFIWIGLLFVWWGLGLPIGVGEGIYLTD